MSKYDIANTIIASIALIISLIPLFVSLGKFMKNRLSTKTLQLALIQLANGGGWNGDWLHSELSITNHTRKEFTISRIIVTANNQKCKVWQAREKNPTLLNSTTHVIKIEPIRMMAHDSMIIDFYIETTFRIETPIPAIISLITPYQKLDYPITLPVQCREDDSNDEQNKRHTPYCSGDKL